MKLMCILQVKMVLLLSTQQVVTGILVRKLLNHGVQIDNSQEGGRKFVSIDAERSYMEVIREVLQ